MIWRVELDTLLLVGRINQHNGGMEQLAACRFHKPKVGGSSPSPATHQIHTTMERTIEQRVAAAILEKATDSIEIGGEVYPLGDPCMATLILVSELISTMPVVEKVPKEQIVYSVLHYAKDFNAVADLLAILILGAGHLTEDIEVEKEIVEYERFLGVFRRKKVKTVTETVTVDKKASLAREIALNVRPSIVFNCIITRLQDAEVAHFFSIITSLSEANILKPTREVANP